MIRIFFHIIRKISYIIFIILPITISAQQKEFDYFKNILPTNSPQEKIESINNLIEANKDTDRAKAIFYAEEYIKFANTLKDKTLLRSAYLNIGRLWELEGSFSVAVEYYNKALEICEESSNKSEIVFIYYRIANTERKLCEFHSALSYCYKGLELCEETNDSTRLNAIYNCFGNIYKDIQEYDIANEYYTKNLEITTKLDDSMGIASAYNNLGCISVDQSSFEQAGKYYLKALDFHGRDKYMAVTLCNLADVFIELGDFPKAKSLLEESFIIRIEVRDRAGLATSYYSFGMYYFKLDSIEPARKNLFIALEIALELDLKKVLKETYFLLNEIYSKEQDYSKAFEYYKKYNEISEDIYNIKKSKAIAYNELKYSNEKIKYRESIARIKRNASFIGVIILIFIIIGFKLMKNKKYLEKEKLEKKIIKFEKKQIEISLQLKNKELSVFALNKASENEVIEKAIQKLKITKYNLKKENQKSIQSIIDYLNRNVSSFNWKEFELRFIEVHADFYNKLLNEFPNITINERRLCAFLRLNMTTKEISSLTKQSIHSIETARSRLRKKLNLVNTNTCMITYLGNL